MTATTADPRTSLAAFASHIGGPLTVPTHAADILRLYDSKPSGPIKLQIIKHRPRAPFDLLAFMPGINLASVMDDPTDYHEGTVQMRSSADEEA